MHEERARRLPYVKAFCVHLNQENPYQAQYIKCITI